MKLRITHTTTYQYDSPVVYGLQQVRLTPCSNQQQNVLSWSVVVDGGREELHYLDQFQNHTTLVQVASGGETVTVTAGGEVETIDTAGIWGKSYGTAPLWLFRQETPLTEAGPKIRKLARGLPQGADLLRGLHDLSASILDAVPYGMGDTQVATTAEEAVAAGGGVCQDHAQIMIAAARSAGLPARYVSGYLMMDDRIDQDASHAWAEVHLPDLGWTGFDVSNGISPDERYVRLATGRDSSEAAPVKGMRLGDAQETMIVALQIQQ